MKHGDICWVSINGVRALARYTQWDIDDDTHDDDAYWAFFGTSSSVLFREAKVIQNTDLRDES